MAKPAKKKERWPIQCPACQGWLAQVFIHRELPPGEWLRCEACMHSDTEVTLSAGGAYKVKADYTAKEAASTPPVVTIKKDVAERARYVGAMRIYADTVCYVFMDPKDRAFYAQPAG